jgi:hypothetical protein
MYGYNKRVLNIVSFRTVPFIFHYHIELKHHLKFANQILTLPEWKEWIIARGCERKAATTCIADAKLEKLI